MTKQCSCGRSSDTLFETERGEFICLYCLTNGSYVQCRECGKYVRRYDAVYDRRNNNYISLRCFNSSNQGICAHCDAIMSRDNLVRVNTNSWDELDYCPECVELHTVNCTHCGNPYTYSELWRNTDDQVICNPCSANYRECTDCHGVFRRSTMSRDEEGYWYCAEHILLHPTYLHPHDYKPSLIFRKCEDDSNSEIPMYMGVELEIDQTRDRMDSSIQKRAAIEISAITDQIYCKRDGSLNCGVEIVSHPCTLNYHMTKLPWMDIMDMALGMGFHSDDVGTCGLHIHVNRDYFHVCNTDIQDLHIAKVIILVNNFWENLVRFSRRDYRQLREWSKKPNLKLESNDSERVIVMKTKECLRVDRYQAVNLTNDSTIEFRLFRGTLDYKTFIATLQFVNLLSSYAKDHSLLDVQTVPWKSFISDIKHPELNDYLLKKDILEDLGVKKYNNINPSLDAFILSQIAVHISNRGQSLEFLNILESRYPILRWAGGDRILDNVPSDDNHILLDDNRLYTDSGGEWLIDHGYVAVDFSDMHF